MKILAVVGGRDFTNYQLMKETIDNYLPIDLIVSGGNGTIKDGEVIKGADKFAIKYARENKIKYYEFFPDWNTHGKEAGPIRNKQIITTASEVIAFHDGVSRGTLSSINYAKEMNKPLQIIKY